MKDPKIGQTQEHQDSGQPNGHVLPPLSITEEQNKLLESALRIKIMHALADEPLTSKQVAEKLHKTPGNIHYHIIKLFEGGLLELVRTEAAGGVIQKFYRSKGTFFHSENLRGFQFRTEDKIEHFTTRLTLSSAELAAFQRELMQVITAWESKITQGDEYGVEFVIGRLPHTDSSSEPEVSP
ncbi:ArsR/SmtB family transcription factor [Paenibacillus ihuae]|uniref:ArsR/SmtB family transcription factor n=1 Tax=Paenibacillus ihuae TaxID=1232431 RepID=UPI0006D56F1A|nr:winged helix-turn-helix domain-containing protein [Paenibacillus ihuae]